MKTFILKTVNSTQVRYVCKFNGDTKVIEQQSNSYQTGTHEFIVGSQDSMNIITEKFRLANPEFDSIKSIQVN